MDGLVRKLLLDLLLHLINSLEDKQQCMQCIELYYIILTACAFSLERQAMMVCAPITASAFAVSYLMPVLPPVTNATFPLRSVTGEDWRAPCNIACNNGYYVYRKI